MPIPAEETQVAVLVDCDNISPAVLAYALRVVATFGRVVVRRGYGNHTTLSNKWQEALVEHLVGHVGILCTHLWRAPPVVARSGHAD